MFFSAIISQSEIIKSCQLNLHLWQTLTLRENMSVCVHSLICITYITFIITGSHNSPVHYNNQNQISAHYTYQTQHVSSEISVFILDIPRDSDIYLSALN